MDYRLIHELPGRMRIELAIPIRTLPDTSWIEGRFSAIEGIKKVSFNHRTKTLLVCHNGRPEPRDALLKEIRKAPLTLAGRANHGSGSLGQKKRAMLLSGFLLMSRPIIPIGMRLWIALFGALPIFRKGIRAGLKGRLNVDILDSSAIGISIARRDYLTAGVIAFLLKVGDYLEEWTRQRSRESLAKMLFLQEWVWIRKNGREERVSKNDIAIGDLVVVRAGSGIPVDGVVVEGEAMVNQSSMTGEPMPVLKREGITVYAGTAIEEGFLVIKAVNVGDETRVSKIIKVIEESEGLKADVQSQAERFADRIVPYSFLLSGLTYALTNNPLKAASVLLVDYSCAIKLSAPLTIMSAMMRSARGGVLIKGGKFIEKLAEADLFVLDKTGTLTEASPKVLDIVPFAPYSREYLLKYAACVEEHFPHPAATAIVKRAEEEGLIHKEEHAELEYLLAHGIASRLNGKRILVGSRHFIHEHGGIDTSPSDPALMRFAEHGHSILYVAIGNQLAGIIVLEDPLRDVSLRFLKMLEDIGIERIIMLTGDNEATAKKIAERLGIKEYHAQVSPEMKAEIIIRLKEEGHMVVMVGDGINDSPALSHADVGVSMRHGADIAKEASDVLILEGDLTGIIHARKTSQIAMSLIRRNFKYIIGINSLLIGLGLLGIVTPAVSAFSHNIVTVLVTTNSILPLARGSSFS